MKILIIAATEVEIAPFLKSEHARNPKIEVLVTGVGMTATAFALGQWLQKPDKVDLLLNVGIAGAFDKAIELGALFRVDTDIFSELGAEDHDKFVPVEELGLGQSIYQSGYTQQYGHANSLPPAKAITVNTVHGHQPSIDNIYDRVHPHLESMEGAAVFYAGEKAKIPCLQIRSVSNYIENRNRAAWKVKQAVENLNDWLIQFVEELG